MVHRRKAIMQAFYASASGPAGERHDWTRFRRLFRAGASIVALIPAAEAGTDARMLSVDEYVAAATPNLEQRGFQEREIGHQTVQYGPLAHVWSAYEAQHGTGAEGELVRGINSVQLPYTEDRWWIVNVTWTNERSAGPVPDEYLALPQEARRCCI
jgi:hypothetical protein